MHSDHRTNEVFVDSTQVQAIATELQKLRTTPRFREWLIPSVTADDETVFRAFLWTAAICHATHGLRGNFGNKQYKGWDFLLRSLCTLAERSPDCISPERLQRLGGIELKRLLCTHAENVEFDLTDMVRRAEIIRNTAIELLRYWDGKVCNLLAGAEHRVGGRAGAYEMLSTLSAFRDRQRKKSTAFLMTVYYSGRWWIKDPADAEPMVDYHRIRLLLRTGCIQVKGHLANALANRSAVDPSAGHLLRDVSSEVTLELQRMTGMPIFDLDVLLWMHARSCCRNKPICISRSYENLSFPVSVGRTGEKSCIFENGCLGAADDLMRSLWEPVYSTEDY